MVKASRYIESGVGILATETTSLLFALRTGKGKLTPAKKRTLLTLSSTPATRNLVLHGLDMLTAEESTQRIQEAEQRGYVETDIATIGLGSVFATLASNMPRHVDMLGIDIESQRGGEFRKHGDTPRWEFNSDSTTGESFPALHKGYNFPNDIPGAPIQTREIIGDETPVFNDVQGYVTALAGASVPALVHTEALSVDRNHNRAIRRDYVTEVRATLPDGSTREFSIYSDVVVNAGGLGPEKDDLVSQIIREAETRPQKPGERGIEDRAFTYGGFFKFLDKVAEMGRRDKEAARQFLKQTFQEGIAIVGAKGDSGKVVTEELLKAANKYLTLQDRRDLGLFERDAQEPSIYLLNTSYRTGREFKRDSIRRYHRIAPQLPDYPSKVAAVQPLGEGRVEALTVTDDGRIHVKADRPLARETFGTVIVATGHDGDAVLHPVGGRGKLVEWKNRKGQMIGKRVRGENIFVLGGVAEVPFPAHIKALLPLVAQKARANSLGWILPLAHQSIKDLNGICIQRKLRARTLDVLKTPQGRRSWTI